MEYIDFNKYKKHSDKSYGGSCEKYSVYINNKRYMLKYPSKVKEKRYKVSYRNSSLSEYISCKIFKLLGFTTQDVVLGTCNNKDVVACCDLEEEYNAKLCDLSDFVVGSNRYHFKPRSVSYDYMQDAFTKQRYVDPQILLDHYWNVFIVDALIGNYDRNLNNIGLLISNNEVLLPIYDCGSSLAPSVSVDRKAYLLNRYSRLQAYVQEKPFTTQFLEFKDGYNKIEYRRTSYMHFFEDGVINSNLIKSINRIIPEIDLNIVNRVIDDISYLSDVENNFYKLLLKIRKEVILDYAYNKFKY